MTKKQVVLSEWNAQSLGYSQFIFNYLNQIKLCSYECYSLYWDLFGSGTGYKELSAIKYKSDLIIWVITDTLQSVDPYNWYLNKKPKGLLHLERICRLYPKKQFILMTEQYEMQKLCYVNNLKFVDLTPAFFRYDKLKYKYNTCSNKNNNSSKKWAILSNYPRSHRITLLSYILLKNLDKFGHIVVSNSIIEETLLHEKIYFLNKDIFQFDLNTMIELNQGFYKLRNKNFQRTMIPIWVCDPRTTKVSENINDTIGNYNNNIIKLYEDIKLEIISATNFFEPTPCFSEKEYQCFYGRNFFIYLNSPRSIQWLRKWGFDVFDDVVNHNYDLIEDPSERMIRAIDDNIHLLDGSADLDQLWKEREERFNQNCLVADNIQEKLDNECKNQIMGVLDEYQISYKNN